MLSKIWNNVEPIGRLRYFLNSWRLGICYCVVMSPVAYIELAKIENTVIVLTGSIFSLAVSLVLILFEAKNVLNRARDIEGTQEITKWHWLVLAYCPVICIVGRFCLLWIAGDKAKKNKAQNPKQVSFAS